MMHQTTLGFSERTERVLAYSLGWISGLFFLFFEKNPNVRWHALQSTGTFGLLSLLFVGVNILKGILSWLPLLHILTNFGLGLLSNIIVWTMVILWVWLIFMALSRPLYRLPYVSVVLRAFM